MTEQPLHETCDNIYGLIGYLNGMKTDLDHMRIISAFTRINSLEKDLNKMLSTVREIALRTEGEHSSS